MDPFIGEIRIFAGRFAPHGWAFCNGQVMNIIQNTALYSLLGVTYGGDGKTTFCLPDLRGRVPIHQGRGTNLTLRQIGQTGGRSTVTLTASQMPAHTHVAAGASGSDQTTPVGNVWGVVAGRTASPLYSSSAPDVSMATTALAAAGQGQPHNNMQPYLQLNFIIALTGIYPSRG